MTQSPSVHPAARLAAGAVAFAATFAARRAMDATYRKTAHHQPPDPAVPRGDVLPALAWAVATAVVSTVIEVAIVRSITRAASSTG